MPEIVVVLLKRVFLVLQVAATFLKTNYLSGDCAILLKRVAILLERVATLLKIVTRYIQSCPLPQCWPFFSPSYSTVSKYFVYFFSLSPPFCPLSPLYFLQSSTYFFASPPSRFLLFKGQCCEMRITRSYISRVALITHVAPAVSTF